MLTKTAINWFQDGLRVAIKGRVPDQLFFVPHCSQETAVDLTAVAAVVANAGSGHALTVPSRRLITKPFAGPAEFAEQLYALADKAGLSHLADAHWIALRLMSPALADRIPARLPEACFDYRSGDRRRRGAPEWPRRCLHSLIDFLIAVQEALGGPAFNVGFLDLDQAGPVARDFFTVLCRRTAGRPIVLWGTAAGDVPCDLIAAAGRYGRKVQQLAATEQPAAPAPTEPVPTARELLDAADYWAYHSAWEEVADCTRLALSIAGPAEQHRIPEAMWAMRLAMIGLAQFTGAEQIMLQELAWADTPRDRVVWLYHLTIVNSQYMDDRPESELYERLCFQEANRAVEPSERAALLLQAMHGSLMVYTRRRRDRLTQALGQADQIVAEHLRLNGPEVERVRQAILFYGMAQTALAVDPFRAVDYYRRSIEADPHFPEYYHHLAAALNQVARHEEALYWCDEAMKRTPPYHMLLMRRGEALQGLGRYGEALANFDRAIELEPGVAENHLCRAVLCHESGALSDAEASYSAYLALTPADTDALINRGSVRHDLGDREGAIADLNEAIRLRPNQMEAYANRAAVLADLNRPVEALADLERALQFAPDHPTLMENFDALRKQIAAEQ